MSFIHFINTSVLGAILGPFLLLLGLFFWFYLKAFPMKHPRRTLSLLFGSEKGKGGGSFRQMTVALAGTLGVGNITGVGVALSVGGPGAILWMWVGALCTMLLKYAEISLTLYEKKEKNQGAYPYIKKSLGKGWGVLFLFLCLLCSFFMGSLLQGNVIAETLKESFSLPPAKVGLCLLFVTLLLFLGGRRFIEGAAAIVIPILSFLYIFFSLGVIFVNITLLPEKLLLILRSAFSLKSIGGGVMGYGLVRAMRAGIAKGLFSHEAGAGTAPLAHGEAKASPAKQGLFGLAEVGIDTLVICTLTALTVLLSFDSLPPLSGTALVSAAFATLYGKIASPLVSSAIVCFSYATVACWVYYGQVVLSFFSERPLYRGLYALLFSLLLPIGALSSSEGAWGVTDALLGVMTLLNGVALFKSRAAVRQLTVDAGLIDEKSPPPS